MLNPGESTGCGGTVPLPGGLTAGTYFVLGVADANDETAESDENDNVSVGGTVLVN